MAAPKDGPSLKETPTWAVAVVCFVLIFVSLIIEHILHMIEQWLIRRHKRPLYEALQKIKSALLQLGFVSLLLTFGQEPISNMCISKAVGTTWHPCDKKHESKLNNTSYSNNNGQRKLLTITDMGGTTVRRVLAAAGYEKCAAKDKVPFVSVDGINQLQRLIFVLAIFHVIYCIITLALSRAKMRKWKAWEMETSTAKYQFSHYPERFRFARETTFGRRHMHFWSSSPILLWTMCFFRQFFRSVPKVDYLTLRYGFIIAHLAPESQSRFNFQMYIKRALEEDSKVIVGVSPVLWFFTVLFILFNTNGWYSYLWLPFFPLIIILLVGTKLQVIITKMGLRIQERGEVVMGSPVVQPGDDLFWFNRPRLILHLIHFVLFQNTFQLAFLAWTWYEFSFKSCYHEKLEDIIIRISMGVLIQIFCSYSTLPLYALVTQMGSSMKPAIFSDRVAKALWKWHNSAKKRIKQNRFNIAEPSPSRPENRSNIAEPSPSPSRPDTPISGTSPISNQDNEIQEASNHWQSYHNDDQEIVEEQETLKMTSTQTLTETQAIQLHNEIPLRSHSFSFHKRT